MTCLPAGPRLLATGFAAAGRPNVVLIQADNIGNGSIGRYAAGLSTPNIDRLMGKGRSFTRAYVSGSVYSPTRHRLLIGRCSWWTAVKESTALASGEPIGCARRSHRRMALRFGAGHLPVAAPTG